MVDPVPVLPADLSLVSVADLAAYMNLSARLTEPGLRVKLEECLTVATEQAEQRVGPLDAAGHTYQVWPSGRSLVLPDTHLQAVTAVLDPHGQPIVVEPEGLNLMAGVLTWHHRLPHGTYLVTATVREQGASLALAIKIMASHLYDVHRGDLTGLREAVSQPIVDGQPRAAGVGFAWPRRALELLKPFARPGAAL